MTVLEKKIDALMRFASADNDYEKENIRKEIRQLLCETDPEVIYHEKEREVRNVLLELKAPEQMVGYAFTIDAVLLAMKDTSYLHNLKWGVYEPISRKYNTSIVAVERGVNFFVTTVWDFAPSSKLDCYFGGIITEGKDKPTNGQFIARLANIVKYDLLKGADGKCR